MYVSVRTCMPRDAYVCAHYVRVRNNFYRKISVSFWFQLKHFLGKLNTNTYKMGDVLTWEEFYIFLLIKLH